MILLSHPLGNDVCYRRISITEEETRFGTEHFLIEFEREYLPKLPTDNRIHGQVLPPPARILDIIKKGVRLRNEIIHKGATVKARTSKEVLEAIADVLRLCDYYSGYDWALNYVSSETRKELGFLVDD